MIRLTHKTHETNPDVLRSCQQGLAHFLARTDLGFPQLPQRMRMWGEIERSIGELKKKYDDLVVVGIGGSSLSSRLIRDLYLDRSSNFQLHICENVDVVAFERLFKDLRDLRRTGWLLISKSGSTIETLVSADFIQQVYSQQGLKFSHQAWVITERVENPLFRWAQANGVSTLELPMDVGGRFSFLTPVGMVPAAFLGASPEQFRLGAEAALKEQDLIAEVMAQALQSFARGEWITFLWIYSSLLKEFGGWWQQLWAESLGKKLDLTGRPAPRVSTPLPAVGACDQHSLLQQVIEGARDKFVMFVRVKASEGGVPLKATQFSHQDFFVGKSMGQLLGAEAQATCQALHQEGVSTLMMEIEDLAPKSMGEWIMFWQLVVAGLGEVLGINAFDQPGVELGKRLAKEILKS